MFSAPPIAQGREATCSRTFSFVNCPLVCSAHSRAAANDFLWTLTCARTCASTLEIARTCARLTAATKSLPSPPTWSLTSSHMPKPKTTSESQRTQVLRTTMSTGTQTNTHRTRARSRPVACFIRTHHRRVKLLEHDLLSDFLIRGRSKQGRHEPGTLRPSTQPWRYLNRTVTGFLLWTW